ncbi:MAG TPA: serine hydrolase domain-containing protein [Chitinophagaceae bacterium]|nr:serine hydrolase domain-containing protein [Chitinophagaceae bacterium]
MKKIVFSVQLFLVLITSAQPTSERLQFKLDSLRVAGNYPGLSLAIIDKDGRSMRFVSGFSDVEKQTALSAKNLLMQGSVGKTYVAAIAIMLIKNGKLDPDKKVSAYLGHHDWYSRIPNASSITIRQIMNHTSGVMRYEFKPDFINDLNAMPAKAWKPEELLRYVLDEKASFAAGEGWEYSDTNYILLGMIIEQLTGKKYYELLREKILEPYKLVNTEPTDKILLPGITQGYAGKDNEFNLKEKVINDDGSFVINPQFEWSGGGIYSTTGDLAKWGKLLYEGKVIDTALMLKDAVAAKLGRDVKYGLGVIIRPTQQGISYGHSGFFPGYLTELFYFPGKRLCIALQSNSSDFKNLKIGLQRILMEIAREFN